MQDKQQSRRGFLKAAAGMAAATAAAPALLASSGKMSNNFYGYDEKVIGSLSKLKSGGSLDFSFPDIDSPCLAVYVDGEVKAYSTLCTHKGCPLMYNATNKSFDCPCHFSKFDATLEGQMVIGHGTSDLPEIFVKVNGDKIVAYGVNGRIYGRESNLKG
jgi:arsenite oxidase small subunit